MYVRMYKLVLMCCLKEKTKVGFPLHGILEEKSYVI